LEKEKKGSLLLKLSYVIYFIILFVISAFYLFPYEKVKDYVEYKASEAILCDVSIEEMDYGPLSGLRFTGINVKKDIKGDLIDIIDIDELLLTSYYSSLFKDTISVKMASNIYDGQLNGTLSIPKSAGNKIAKIDMDVKNLDISKYHALSVLSKSKLMGILSGSASLLGSLGDINSIQGDLNISITDGLVAGVVINDLGSGFIRIEKMELPDITYKSINASLNKEQRVIKIKKFSISGDDVNAQISGNLNIGTSLRGTSSNLGVKVSLSESYLSKDKTLSLFDSNFNSMKDKDGYYNIKVEGSLLKPRIKAL